VRGVDGRLDILPLSEAELRALPITLRLGPIPADIFAGCAGVAISPGVSPKHPAVAHAVAAGIPVFGELELQVPLPVPCIAISGTNGKSTTTALTGTLVQGLGRQAFIGGNLGDPIAGWLDAGAACDVAVLELSSYQLDCAYRFAPEVAVLLNVTPDHLERYGTFAAYVASKTRLVAAVPPHGRVILNYDDPEVRAMAAVARAPIWWFSTQLSALPAGLDGAVLAADAWMPQGGLAHQPSFSLQHPRLLGDHNRQNALAAVLAAKAFDPKATGTQLQVAYNAFAGLEHRLELAGEVAQVQYINDSKATNDASAATAVQAMDRPVVLLVGGFDKGGGYARLRQACSQRPMRHVVAFGAAAQVIAAALADLPVAISCVSGLEPALERARALAQPGDVVLMAPACSSFDAFADYRQRGRAFKDWVRRQKGSA
jgi:UDP-N-acetylmuramoylalanine--D-glutamate ligase